MSAGQIISQNSFNPANLQLDGLYIVNVPPPTYLSGAPTNIGGLVGTASWGPVNKAILVGSTLQLQQTFGQLASAASTDQHDLITEGLMAFAQAQGLGSSMSIVAVRVTDGTDVAASGLIQDTSSNPLVSISSLYTGSFGNQAVVTTSAGAKSGTTNVSVVMPGEPAELYPAIPNSSFQSSLISAINSGISGIRGPSALIKASLPLVNPPVISASEFTPSTTGGSLSNGNVFIKATYTNANGETTASNEVEITLSGGTATQSIGVNLGTLPFGATGIKIYVSSTTGTEEFEVANASGSTATITSIPTGAAVPPTSNTATITNTNPPSLASYSLSGGTDGRNVTSAQLVGSDYNPSTSAAATGAYALRGQNVSVFAICGLTDTTTWSNLVPLADSEGMVIVLPFAQGTSTSSAISTKQTLGINDPNVVLMKDWLYFFDSINNVVRAIPPDGVAVGHGVSLNPAQNWGNKPVFGIIGTDRLNPVSGPLPYTNAELGQLEASGINVIYNPIPAGNVFGFRFGVNSSSNPVQSVIEYATLTNFLDKSFANNLGIFVGALQSQSPNDPLRQAVVTVMNQFLSGLQSRGLIDGFQVQCDLNNNTPATIAAHYLYVYVKVVYLSSVRFFVVQLQGGTTVVVNSGITLGAALAGTA